LAVLLALNFLYHEFLSGLLPSVEEPERMLAGREWLYILAYCLQPAIVEELFFRGLVLDWFRTAMGTAGAIIVSSVMFALCHVYAPIGVPYLFVAGAAFAAARILTGGLALPMALHFAHNLAVTLIEHHRA
jgi:membrane protease YdiL (CAAX protease family)